MKTKTPESNKNTIPLLIRSDRWTVAERTEKQISAICLKCKQDDMIMQMNQKINQQSQMINQQNQKIDRQNQMINQQNQKIDSQSKLIDHQIRKIDDLNNLLSLQKDINAELQKVKDAQKRIQQKGNTGKTVGRQPVPNKPVKSPSSISRTNILMADSNQNSDATVFGSSTKRREISSIYTRNTLKHIPSSAWDVSAAKDGSVMAWTQLSSDWNTFILYLAADGDIYANPDSSYLFANYTNLTSSDFTYFQTNLVTNMHAMFEYCDNLEQLDVSLWDVSNVTDMAYMFCSCKQLQTLNVSHWDVSNVTDMGSMFSFCEQLQTLNVSQWDVSNVTDMQYMFNQCVQLASIDVSKWDVSNVIHMSFMFSSCPYINQLEKGALSSWKRNSFVAMGHICDGTKYEKNSKALFQKGLFSF